MSADPDAGPGASPGAVRVSTPRLLALGIVAFVVELAIFGGVSAVAHRAAGGGLAGWVAAVVATAAVLVLWGVFVAPKGRLRMPAGARALASAALCLATAYGLVQAGFTGWGWFVGVAGFVVVAAQLVMPSGPGETSAGR